MALFNIGASMSVISQKFFDTLLLKPKLVKSNAYTVTSANVTDLRLIGQCNLTFKLGKKYFTDEFIVQ